jgi:hypothetical protein
MPQANTERSPKRKRVAGAVVLREEFINLVVFGLGPPDVSIGGIGSDFR